MRTVSMKHQYYSVVTTTVSKQNRDITTDTDIPTYLEEALEGHVTDACTLPLTLTFNSNTCRIQSDQGSEHRHFRFHMLYFAGKVHRCSGDPLRSGLQWMHCI